MCFREARGLNVQNVSWSRSNINGWFPDLIEMTRSNAKLPTIEASYKLKYMNCSWRVNLPAVFSCRFPEIYEIKLQTGDRDIQKHWSRVDNQFWHCSHADTVVWLCEKSPVQLCCIYLTKTFGACFQMIGPHFSNFVIWFQYLGLPTYLACLARRHEQVSQWRSTIVK